ncbi:heavy-metal-associated domain-containing protein [Cognatitamlana onchidii]|uniref:heavy-metal-associated domain-containing protein n=1 Tax=Cognatitamlana onchidii TaxID=2562860 RepID=UPI0010A64775|nr:heavy-metal-associated domain-containing protein [Algibacter onchidii]
MKTIVILIMLTASLGYGQNKNAKASMEVNGVCMMCKTRIEKACYKTKGVKSAVWNVNTHELRLIYDERKTDINTIQSNILGVGHDVKDLKATDEAYATVHPCCRYRDNEVRKDHEDNTIKERDK